MRCEKRKGEITNIPIFYFADCNLLRNNFVKIKRQNLLTGKIIRVCLPGGFGYLIKQICSAPSSDWGIFHRYS